MCGRCVAAVTVFARAGTGNTRDFVMRHSGDGFEYVFPAAAAAGPDVPCGWQIQIPATVWASTESGGLIIPGDWTYFKFPR